MWWYKKKVCDMIQPVSAFSPRAISRGPNEMHGKSYSNETNYKIALINTTGFASFVCGVTTLVSRSYAHSWTSALALGACSSFLSVFFMTPHLMDVKLGTKDSLKKKVVNNSEESLKLSSAIKNFVKSTKTSILFKQSNKINPSD